MSWEEWHREVISRQRSGMLATVARGALSVAAKIYGTGVGWRNSRYDRDPTAVHRVNVPVVSVGNLTTGGTGKSPLVAWISGWFQQQGLRVAIVSRGYAARPGRPNDEALELQWRLPEIPHVQDPDRVAAARRAIAAHRSQIIVLDDAFQHRRIHRDLDVVLIDALEPFGHEHLLPRGLLREPISALARAQVVALSRADLVPAEERREIRVRIEAHAPRAIWVELAHRPQSLVSSQGESRDITLLQGRRIAAFCGIGNPAGFRRTLQTCGADVVAWREFPDHHVYGESDRQSLAKWSDALDVELVLCTMKDFVKLRVDQLGQHHVRALAIQVEVLAGREELSSQLLSIASRAARE